MWAGCESPSGPSPDLLDTRIGIDTLYVVDTVVVWDTAWISGPPTGDGPTRLGGSLAWGGGPAIGSSQHIVARLPDGRWGIGTDAPQAALHLRAGDFRVENGGFRFLVSGDYQGEDPAGYGVSLNRATSAGSGPMGITFQQDEQNYWGLGLDENTVQPYPDYVSVFETAAGDIFRFRSGGRALLGNGVGHPEANHVLTLVDRENSFIENVLNLRMETSGNGARLIHGSTADDPQAVFAVGRDGSVGIGRDVSATSMLTVDGSVEALSFLRLSDARLKTSVTPLTNSLDRVRALRPVSFLWQDAQEVGGQTGLIAQEVAQVVPNAVDQNDEGYQRVDYQAISIELLRAVQELSAEVDRLGIVVGQAQSGSEGNR